MPAEIYIGTSGYSYADWVGPFYKDGMERSEFLPYYAHRFPCVELNFSYYKQPDSRLLERMVTSTPDDFLFTIKAHRSLTHEIGGSWRDEAKTFIEAIAPLEQSNRLGAVLFQFPYSFHYEPVNRRYLARLCDVFSDRPVAVEWRNREWQQDSVFAELEQRKIAYVMVDYPPIDSLPDPIARVTAPAAYLRFHGRNSESWWTGDNKSRYDYLYDDEELDEWSGKIAETAGKAKILIVMFNNHWRGQAVRNAGRLREMLEKRGDLSVYRPKT